MTKAVDEWLSSFLFPGQVLQVLNRAPTLIWYNVVEGNTGIRNGNL